MATKDDYRKVEELSIEANEFVYNANKNLEKAKEYFDEGLIVSGKGFMSDEVANCINDLSILEDKLNALNSHTATRRKILENQISEEYIKKQQEIAQKYSTESQTSSSQTSQQSTKEDSSNTSNKKKPSSPKKNGVYFTEHY